MLIVVPIIIMLDYAGYYVYVYHARLYSTQIIQKHKTKKNTQIMLSSLLQLLSLSSLLQLLPIII